MLTFHDKVSECGLKSATSKKGSLIKKIALIIIIPLKMKILKSVFFNEVTVEVIISFIMQKVVKCC